MKKVILGVIGVLVLGAFAYVQGPALFPDGIQLGVQTEPIAPRDGQIYFDGEDAFLRDEGNDLWKNLSAAGGGAVTASQGLSVDGSDVQLGGSAIDEQRTINISSAGLSAGSLRFITFNSGNNNQGLHTISPESITFNPSNSINSTSSNFTISPTATSLASNQAGVASTLTQSVNGMALNTVQGGSNSGIEFLSNSLQVNSTSIGTPVIGNALVYTSTNGDIGQAQVGGGILTNTTTLTDQAITTSNIQLLPAPGANTTYDIQSIIMTKFLTTGYSGDTNYRIRIGTREIVMPTNGLLLNLSGQYMHKLDVVSHSGGDSNQGSDPAITINQPVNLNFITARSGGVGTIKIIVTYKTIEL